jgi:hypothetical protein
MAKLAALVPKPRTNLTRYHGVLAPNSKHRIHVTPARRGKGRVRKQDSTAEKKEQPADVHQEMRWAQRLKRVFNIDITTCSYCGGVAKIMACIEESLVIQKILDHLDATLGALTFANQLPEPRASPQVKLSP